MVVRLVRKQSIDPKIIAQVGVQRVVFCDHTRFTGFHHTGHDSVADFHRFIDSVHRNVFPLGHHDSGAFMTEHIRDQFKRIAVETMDVGTADAAGLDLDKHLVVADLANRKFADLHLFRSHQNGRPGSFSGCRRSGRRRNGVGLRSDRCGLATCCTACQVLLAQ